MSWTYKGESFTEIPDGAEAFVYKIVFASGEYYIGKKNLYSTRRLPPLKGKKRKRVVTKESDWRTYTSSSDLVNQKINDGEPVASMQILHLCKAKGVATWLELKEMILHDVLCNPLALNLNILGKFYKCYGEDDVLN